MASLTKEQLRNELISHGVELPASSARKEELVRLYETYVSPIASMKGDFSSDEENDIIEIDSKASSVPEVTEVVTVADLSDEQLYDELVARGVSVGPIVDSTRAIYQRKLIALLSEPGAIGAVNGSSSDQFSDSEGEPEPEIPAPATPAPATPAPPTPASEPVSINDLEQCSEPETPVVYVREDSPTRPPSVAAAALIPDSEPIPSIRSRFADLLPPASPLAALPLVDRQGTPTPRPSIRSFSTTSSYSYDSSRRFMDATDSAAAAPSQATGQAPKNKWTRYIIAITVAALAAIIAYTLAPSAPVQQLQSIVSDLLHPAFGDDAVIQAAVTEAPQMEGVQEAVAEVVAEALVEAPPPVEAVPEAAPEVEAEAVPEVVAEAAPEVAPVAPEIVTEAAPEAAPEAVAEVVAEAAPEAVPEVVAEAAPEVAPVVAEVVVEAAPEAAPEVVAETVPEAVVEAAPEPAPVVAEAAPEAAPEVVAEATPEVVAEAAAEAAPQVAPIAAEAAAEAAPTQAAPEVTQAAAEEPAEIILELAGN